MRKIVLLGSTGSIGTQTLDVVRNNPQELEVVGLAANTRVAEVEKHNAEDAGANQRPEIPGTDLQKLTVPNRRSGEQQRCSKDVAQGADLHGLEAHIVEMPDKQPHGAPEGAGKDDQKRSDLFHLRSMGTYSRL